MLCDYTTASNFENKIESIDLSVGIIFRMIVTGIYESALREPNHYIQFLEGVRFNDDWMTLVYADKQTKFRYLLFYDVQWLHGIATLVFDLMVR